MSCPKSPPTLGSSSKDGLGHGGSIPTSPVPDKSALGSVPTVKVGRSRSGDRPRPGETSPASPTALGSCLRDQAGGGSQTAPVSDDLGLGSVSAIKTGCSRSGDRPGFSGSGPASPAARDEVLVQDGVEASSSLHRHPLRAAVGSLKQGISKDEVAQEGREQTPPPPPNVKLNPI